MQGFVKLGSCPYRLSVQYTAKIVHFCPADLMTTTKIYPAQECRTTIQCYAQLWTCHSQLGEGFLWHCAKDNKSLSVFPTQRSAKASLIGWQRQTKTTATYFLSLMGLVNLGNSLLSAGSHEHQQNPTVDIQLRTTSDGI